MFRCTVLHPPPAINTNCFVSFGSSIKKVRKFDKSPQNANSNWTPHHFSGNSEQFTLAEKFTD